MVQDLISCDQEAYVGYMFDVQAIQFWELKACVICEKVEGSLYLTQLHDVENLSIFFLRFSGYAVICVLYG